MLTSVFFGTPDFSVGCLRAAAAGSRVLAVVTGPDMPRGRGQHLQPSPVKAAALELGLPVLQPESLREPAFIDQMTALGADLGVVVAFGRILGRRLLRAPRLGCVNVHASLLPLLRGAAPIQRAVMQGHAETGVAIMQMTLGLDEGPVHFMERTPIGLRETGGELHDRLAVLGAEALAEFLRRAAAGPLAPALAQDARGSTYAEKLGPVDEWLDWRRSARELDCQIRGLAPRPGACSRFRGERLRVLEAVPVDVEGEPGTVRLDAEPVVACGEGGLRLTRVQAAGRKAVTGREFVNGAHLVQGEVFGEEGGPP